MRLLIFLFISSAAFGQDYSKKSKANIHMYAELLVGSKIVEMKEDVDFRAGHVYYYKTKDLAGDYVHISGGFAGDYQMKMYKLKSGNDLVGVTEDNCQAVCKYAVTFLEFREKDSVDVTNDILPLEPMFKHLGKMHKKAQSTYPELKGTLPQYHFILQAASDELRIDYSSHDNQVEFPLLLLKWNGLSFQIIKKYKSIPSS